MPGEMSFERLTRRIEELEAQNAELTEAARELLDSREWFRTVADFTHDWEYWIGEDGEYRYVSPACRDVTGYAPDEFLRAPDLLLSIIHPDDREHFVRHTREELNVLEDISVEFRIVTRTGENRWISHKCRRVHGTDGRFLGRRAGNRDITHRKHTERALREGEARYRGIVEHTDNGIVVLRAVGDGEDFIFLEFNPAAERIDSIDRARVLGRSVLEVFPRVKEFGLFDVLKRVWASGTPEKLPLAFYSDRRISGWRENFVYRLASGEVVVLYSDETGVQRTRDALRESERALSTLMDNLPGMAYRCRNDAQWTMEFISKGCRGLTGYGRAELIENRELSYNDLILPQDRPGVWDGVQEALARKAPFRLTYRIRTAQAQEKWVWEQGVGVFSDEGELRCLEGLVTDITERKTAEEHLREAHEALSALSLELEIKVKERTRELRKKTAQLLEAERLAALGSIVNRVAHEVRNPLMVVGGFARRLFEKTADDDPNKEYLEIILSEVKMLEEAISKIVRVDEEH